jgi:hypothetical protein
MDLSKLTPAELLAEALRLQNENAAQAQKIADGESAIEKLNSIISRAGQNASSPEEEKSSSIKGKVVTIKNKDYKWNAAAFQLPGDTNRYSAAAAMNDPQVLDKLLKVPGQRILVFQE